MIIISACLCGFFCRYNGQNAQNKEALALLRTGQAVPVCPEQLGGLPTPRPPVELLHGDGAAVLRGDAQAVTAQGVHVTAAFINGAAEVLHMARLYGADRAILKNRSPSCGCGELYDGSFTGKIIKGDGVCAALLRQHGVHISTR